MKSPEMNSPEMKSPRIIMIHFSQCYICHCNKTSCTNVYQFLVTVTMIDEVTTGEIIYFLIVASLFSPIVSPGDHAAQILSTQSTAAPSSSFRQGNARWNDTAPAVGRHGSSHRAINRMNQLLSSTSDNSAICDLPVGGATRNAVRSNRTSESSSRAANVAKVVSPSSAVVSGTEADEKAEKDARRDVSSVDSVNVESADNGRGKSERPSVSELRKKFLQSNVTENEQAVVSVPTTSKKEYLFLQTFSHLFQGFMILVNLIVRY